MSGKYLSINVHFTWSTADREPWLQTTMRKDLYAYIGGIVSNKRAKLISAGGVADSHTPLRFTALEPQRRRLCERCEIQFFKMGARLISTFTEVCMAGRIRCIQCE